MAKIKYTCHGAGRSIGASCIELNLGGTRLLLDYGIEISQPINKLPTKIEGVKNINLVFGTHPHVDHMGGIPILYQNSYDGPVIGTELCFNNSAILLYDSFKLEKQNMDRQPYNPAFISYARKRMVESWHGSVGEINYRLIPAGHIPGSVCVYLEYRGRKILYTGDVNGYATRLMGKSGELPKADILILDATYGNAKHPTRKSSEKKLTEIIAKTIKRGGSVLIGTYAVAKAQELQLFISQLNLGVPCYLDGMARQIAKLYLKPENAKFLKNNDLVMADRRWKHISCQAERQDVLIKQAVIVSSSGSLNGGVIMNYLPTFLSDKKSVIITVGHQFEKSNGRMLHDYGKVVIGRETYGCDCEYNQITYSSHSDSVMLKKMIDRADPRLVIAQHGDDQAIDSILAYANKQGREIWGPTNGESQII